MGHIIDPAARAHVGGAAGRFGHREIQTPVSERPSVPSGPMRPLEDTGWRQVINPKGASGNVQWARWYVEYGAPVLEIEFMNKRKYRYRDVSRELFDGMMNAGRPGIYFYHNIRAAYTGRAF